MVSTILLYPLDLAKTRIAADMNEKPQYTGIIDCWKKVYNAQGFTALYNGLFVCLIGDAIYRGLKYGIYDGFRPFILELLEGTNEGVIFLVDWLYGWIGKWSKIIQSHTEFESILIVCRKFYLWPLESERDCRHPSNANRHCKKNTDEWATAKGTRHSLPRQWRRAWFCRAEIHWFLALYKIISKRARRYQTMERWVFSRLTLGYIAIQVLWQIWSDHGRQASPWPASVPSRTWSSVKLICAPSNKNCTFKYCTKNLYKLSIN